MKVQISVNFKLSVFAFVRFYHMCLRVIVWDKVVMNDEGTRLKPPGFIWAKQEGPVSVWASLLSAVGPQSHEQKVPPHNSHLSSSSIGTYLSL